MNNNGENYSFSKKFVEGETLSGFWNIALQLAGAVNSIIVIALLSVYEYGVYQLVLSVAAIAISLSAGIFDDLVVTDLSRYFGKGEKGLAKKLFGEYAIFKILIGVLLTAIILLGSEGIARHYNENIALFLRIISIAFLLEIAQSVFNVFFKGKLYFKSFGASAFGEVSKLGILLLIFFTQGVGVLQVLWVYVAGQFFALIFSGIHFIRLYRNQFLNIPLPKVFLLKDLMKQYGFWIALRYIFSRVANNIRPWIIKTFLNTEAVGLFTFARNLIAYIARLLPFGTLGSLLPREVGDENKMHFIFARSLKYSIWLGILAAAASFLVGPIAISYIFPNYVQAIPIFQALTIILVLYGFYKIFRLNLIALKEQKALFIRSFDNSILAPLMLVLLLPFFGVMGAAIEWVITYLITTTVFYYYLVKNHPYLRLKLKEFLPDRYDKEILKNLFNLGFAFVKSKFKRTS